ncbi:MAG: tRNA (N(6)-L-threonylcarbamoyladenosine(37)-C(2))-methylthiotransferase MtaB [Clostridiales bacterium]|nr:tRNA (N(6)-L-threonylcarbamoyladenosine(37)-C(2))-methylthiotransferase MtaB [Clostridiales bacterium]
MKSTVALLSLGCKVNSYETEAMRGMFEANGYSIVDFKEVADIYVINTCTVTNIADRKSRQMLHQARKRNPKGIIAAVGCYVQASDKKLTEDNTVDIIVGNNKKSDIVTLVERYMKNQDSVKKGHLHSVKKRHFHTEELVIDINKEKEYEDLNVSSTLERTRAFIKIQDGCNRFCSYCIIPYVRGRVRSRIDEDILDEIAKLSAKGYKEFVLTGIHISSYGTDLMSDDDKKKDINPLADLIIKVSMIKGVERIRLGSLEPRIISEAFVQAIAKVKQFSPHFHLSLQSGSDSVLKGMNRKYSAQEYYEKILLLRKYFVNPAFTTDIIVGFPGETEGEFQETIDFVQKIGFSQIHVFKYSKREGTVAANMDNQIPEDVKSSRSHELIEVSATMSKEYKALFMGRIEKVLVEEVVEINGNSYNIGHNERYIKLAVESSEDLSNEIIEGKVLKNLTDEILYCDIIKA